MPLTDKQQQFLDYLEEKISKDGKAPSLRQAATDFGVSHNAVAQLLNQLERKEVIERDGHYSRTIRLRSTTGTERQHRGSRELPVIGQITAGLPMYAQQEWDESVIVDQQLFSGDNLFCLRVKGQSMRDAGILNGDLVICEPRQYAENGEIIVALLHGEEATVKRFQLHKDHIVLHPENPDFAATTYQFNELMVQGKIIGVIRHNISDRVGESPR